VYDVKFKSYFGEKQIRFGSWGRRHHIRLFNRGLIKWSEQRVHESLLLPKHVKREKIGGYLHHYSVKDAHECNSKAVLYARLSAEEYFQNGKEANFIKLYLSPVFSFFIGYIIYLGLLDGKEGWYISKITFKNKWLKYHHLNRIKAARRKRQFVKRDLTVEY